MTVGESIRALREAKGLSQRELGVLVGVGESAVSRWESGRVQPSLGSLLSLATALSVGLGELVSGPEEAAQ